MTTTLEATHLPIPIASDGYYLLDRVLERPPRSMRQWAEDEIVLPNGPFRGQRFRCSRIPCAGIWFDLVDSKRWLIHVATGPSQSGKTLSCFVIPTLYCLFEKGEDVIVGLPDLDMASSKWNKDLLPVIRQTRYADLLPTVGPGSKGASKTKQIRFKNGTTLTFMSFGGGDKSRAGETAPNLIITETDGGGEMTEASDEASPIEQLIARTMASDLDAFIVMECTVSTTLGQTWMRYKGGTESRLVRPCPKCKEYVTPERKHFRGWQSADNEIDAGELAGFHCPECGQRWTDEERFAANQRSKVVHRGQVINRDGQVSGQVPKTRTLGFRWSAVDNSFRSSRYLGSLEWSKAREVDQEAAQRAMNQFQYAIPLEPDGVDDEFLDPYAAMKRIGTTKRNIVPYDHDVVSVGTDIGDKRIHWAAVSWSSDDCRGQVINYGTVKVYSRTLGADKAIRAALRYLRDKILTDGFQVEGSPEAIPPLQWWIDAGWRNKVVYKFIRECDGIDAWRDRVRPAVGRGAGTQYKYKWTEKHKTDKNVTFIGEDYFFARQRKFGVQLVVINADAWKSFVQSRMMQDIIDEDGEHQPGAMTLFVPETDHSQFCRHLAAERETTVFIPDQGEVKVWKTVSRTNHYLDATYIASAAANFCGVELISVQPDPGDVPGSDDSGTDPGDDFTTPDGRPFYYEGGPY